MERKVKDILTAEEISSLPRWVKDDIENAYSDAEDFSDESVKKLAKLTFGVNLIERVFR